MDYNDFIITGISIGLGLLIGLQREHVDKKIAGIRTFTLISIFGTISGFLAREFESVWIVGLNGLCLAIMIALVNILKTKEENPSFGQTTEVAMLLVFSLGAYLVFGSKLLIVGVGTVTAILLHFKDTIENFVDTLDGKDMKAIMQFAAISLIILPILPDQTFGPYDVLNAREIWLMVVLIVGIGLVGYFLFQWLSKEAGTITNGILGGLISSTATTFTFAGLTKNAPKTGRLAAFVIVTASAIAFVRVLVEVAVVAPNHLWQIAPPMIGMFVFMIIICVILYLYNNEETEEEIPSPDNPAQLKGALIFGFLYAVVLLAVAASKDYFGEGGLYIVSIISGLTDMDAITLSLSKMVASQNIEADQGWRLILLAGLSNLVFKGGVVFTVGNKNLKKYIGIAFGLCIAVGLLAIFLWPKAG